MLKCISLPGLKVQFFWVTEQHLFVNQPLLSDALSIPLFCVWGGTGNKFREKRTNFFFHLILNNLRQPPPTPSSFSIPHFPPTTPATATSTTKAEEKFGSKPREGRGGGRRRGLL